MAIQKRHKQRALAPWRPFSKTGEMDRWLEDLFGLYPLALWRQTPLTMGREWIPAIDIFEKSGQFMIKAELPGIKPDDIDISVSGNTMTIKGEKKTECETKEENYHRSECAYGSFYRSIRLPSNANTERVQADYENGVLEVTIPKVAESKSKKIEITT